jgi:hypothetical protein
MRETTRNETIAVVSAYDFSQFRTIVDVAGGLGVLLASILERNPACTGILFELPHVIESARKALDKRMASRLKLVAGDFFKELPAGGDLYILKNIIHDWNDVKSQDILATLSRAMNGRGRLVLVEFVVCGPNSPCQGKMTDVNMMVRTGGRNRTENEYRELLASRGFTLTRVIASRGGPHLIEAAPWKA